MAGVPGPAGSALLMQIWHGLLGLMLAVWPLGSIELRADRFFLDRVVTIDGMEHRYRVFVPPQWTDDGSWPVVLALHGGGGYGSDGLRQTQEGLAPAVQRHPERFPALIVFPQVPANGTPGWQELGGQIALATLDRTIDEFHGDRSRVVVTGLSIGGNGAWFLAYHHAERFAGVLVVCGFVAERMGTMYPIRYPSLVPGVADPSALVARRLAGIPIWMFHGSADRTVPVEQSRRMAAALHAQGAEFQYTELPGVDHNAWDIAYDRQDVARWLVGQHRHEPGQ